MQGSNLSLLIRKVDRHSERRAGLRERAKNPIPMKCRERVTKSRSDKMENRIWVTYTLIF